MRWRTVYTPSEPVEKKRCPHRLLFTPDRLGIIIQCSKCKQFFHSESRSNTGLYHWVEGCNHPDIIKITDETTYGYSECGICGEEML